MASSARQGRSCFPARPGRNQNSWPGGARRVSSNALSGAPSAGAPLPPGAAAAQNLRDGLALFRAFGAGVDNHEFHGFEPAEARLAEARSLHRRRLQERDAHFLANPPGTPLPPTLRNLGEHPPPLETPILPSARSVSPAVPAQSTQKSRRKVQDEEAMVAPKAVSAASGKKRPQSLGASTASLAKPAKSDGGRKSEGPKLATASDVAKGVPSKRSKGKEEKISAAPPVKKTKTDPNVPKAPTSTSFLIRPSKLGSFEGLSSQTTPSSSSSSSSGGRLFGSSPTELIVEGKRQWKPSFKVQESQEMKKTISQYANAVAGSGGGAGGKAASNSQGGSAAASPSAAAAQEKIQRILASQWDSRLRKVDNKFVKSSRTSEGTGCALSDAPKSPSGLSKPVLLRESKLELNRVFLDRLQSHHSQQVEFYEAIQQSMQRPDRSPPKLLSGASVNPAGTALVEQQSPPRMSSFSASPSSSGDFSLSSSTSKAASSTASSSSTNSNRMPGNIICGICGAVRYYSFILQAKKFGTFSCEPCRKFISKMIRQLKGLPEDLQVDCVSGTGTCVVPPVLRNAAGYPAAKSSGQSESSGDSSIRCQACWLKLCLIGYKLDSEQYDQLRSHLPQVVRDQLPEGSKRGSNGSLLPHRGEILEFNRQVPLSRPLFEGFGVAPEKAAQDESASSTASPGQPSAAAAAPAGSSVPSTAAPGASSNSSASGGAPSSSTGAAKAAGVHERLPNGWMKKAVQRQDGKWDVFLITPDQKMLKSPSDLKLYIAKSGAVIDSNIINFSLPKKTAKATKRQSQQQQRQQQEQKQEVDTLSAASNETTPKKPPDGQNDGGSRCVTPSGGTPRQQISPSAREMRKLGFEEGATDTRNITSMELPRSGSRRETKVPAKFRDYSPVKRKKRGEKGKADEEEDENSRMEEDETVKSTKKASKRGPATAKTLSGTIGVGTFSIDTDTVKGLSTAGSLSDMQIKMSKKTIACKSCQNCSKKNCNQCSFCLDRIENGGKGTLKKVCIERRCLNPQMNGLPSMSTFRHSSPQAEPKRSYIRTATALATRSVPLPASPAKANSSLSIETAESYMPGYQASPLKSSSGVSPPASNSTSNTTTATTTPSPTPPPPSATLKPAENPLSSLIVTPSMQDRKQVRAERILQERAAAGTLSLKERHKLSDKLNENPSTARPNLSFAALIVQALRSLPGEEGTLQMMYTQIRERYPYYRLCDQHQWQNSIRHNLSLQKAFVRTDKKEGKGYLWGLAKDFNFDIFEKKPFREEKGGDGTEEEAPPVKKKLGRPRKHPLPEPPTAPTDTKVSGMATPPESPPPPRTSQVVVVPAGPSAEEMARQKRKSLEDFLEIGLENGVGLSSESPAAAAPPPIVVKAKPPSDFASGGGETGKAVMGSMDYWEQYDPEEILHEGQGIVTTEDLEGVDVLCFLCGSAGRDQMIFCKSCCEPFHPFCLQQEELPQTEELEKNWVCRRCAPCLICGEPGEEVDSVLRCSQCCGAFHKECLQPEQRKDHKIYPWTCFNCLKCKSCGKSEVSHYLEGSPLCSTCCLQKRQGSYCPLCEGCYDDDDYDTRMMECARCGGWVHARCEGVDAEKYQILSYLPDTVEYVCKKCDQDEEASWMKAVRAELRVGQEIVLNQVIQSKSARLFLKAANTTAIGSNDEDEEAPNSFAGEEEDFSPSFKVEKVDEQDGKELAMEKLRQKHGLKDCEVQITKLSKVPNWAVERVLLRRKAAAGDKECSVPLLDLRYHPWHGPQLRKHVTRKNWKPPPQEALVQEPEVLDLTVIKELASGGEYESVLNFHLAFKKVCETVHVRGPRKRALVKRMKKQYVAAMKEVFPWFEVDNPTAYFEPQNAREAACRPPHQDHIYSDHTLGKKRAAERKVEESKPPQWKATGVKPAALRFRDKRRCVLCAARRDAKDDGPGRLIYFRHNEWVHVNCALWSSEVYEEVDGSLQNVPQAVARGAKLSCTRCKERGATVGCCQAGCDGNYHFACGLRDGASYYEDKTVYCARHSWKYADKAESTDFSVWRTVYVDLEDNKKKSKKVDLSGVKVKVGSLLVERLGELRGPAVSDSEEALLPVGFCCSRLFWSHVEPDSVVKYWCRTKLIVPESAVEEEDGPVTGEEFNLRIDHESDDREAVAREEKKLDEFRRRLRKIEMKKLNKLSDILPPRLVGKVWSAVKYEDLHTDDAAVETVDMEMDETPVNAVSHSGVEAKSPQVHNQAREESVENISAMETVSSVSPFQSPSKKLNKAVGNIINRKTPTKSSIDLPQQHDPDLDLALGEDFFLEDADNDLISGILKETNFEEELEKTTDGALLRSSSLQESSSTDGQDGASPMRKALKCDRKEEVTVMKTWFNQNKMRKFSEVRMQCSLPFDTHVFDMEVDYSDLINKSRGDARPEVEDEEDAEEEVAEETDTEVSLAASGGDLLGFVAENMEKGKLGQREGEEQEHSANEINDIDILNKILSLSADKLLEMGAAGEQTFELGAGSNEVTFTFAAEKTAENEDASEEQGTSVSAGGDEEEQEAAMEQEGGEERGGGDEIDRLKRLHSQAAEGSSHQVLPQLDGADDEDDDKSDGKENGEAAAAVKEPTSGDKSANVRPENKEPSLASSSDPGEEIPPPKRTYAPGTLIVPAIRKVPKKEVADVNVAEEDKVEKSENAEVAQAAESPDKTPSVKQSSDAQDDIPPPEIAGSQAQALGESDKQVTGEKATEPPALGTTDKTSVEAAPAPARTVIEAGVSSVPEVEAKLAIEPSDTDQKQQAGEKAEETSDGKPSSPKPADDKSKVVGEKEADAAGEPEKKDGGGGDASSESNSPRKDFSIAGLLSPPTGEGPGEKAPPPVPVVKMENPSPGKSSPSPSKKAQSSGGGSDDEVVILPSPSAASSSGGKVHSPRSRSRMQPPSSPMSPRKLLPKTSGSSMSSPPAALATPAAPPTAATPIMAPAAVAPPQGGIAAPAPVFVQQFSTPEQASSFTESFQNTTGRSLQYVASIPHIHGAATLSPFPQQLQLAPGAAATMIQPLSAAATPTGAATQSAAAGFLPAATQLHLTPQGYISAVPAQQLSYITPQGIIVNQAAAAPGFVSLTPGAALQTPLYLSPTPQAASPAPSFLSQGVAPPMSPFPPMPPSSSVATQQLQQQQSLFSMTTAAGFQQQQQQHTVITTTTITQPPLPTTVVSTPPKKIARVQPQPSSSGSRPHRPTTSKQSRSKAATHPHNIPGRIDPIKALSSMASQPMATNSSQTSSTAARLSITHGGQEQRAQRHQQQSSHDINVTDLEPPAGPSRYVPPPTPPSPGSAARYAGERERHRSVGTQAKIGGPLKILTSRPWMGSETLGAAMAGAQDPRPLSTTSSSCSRPASLTTPLPLLSAASSGVSADDGGSLSRPESNFSQEAEEAEATPVDSRASTPMTDHNYFISPASTPEAHRAAEEKGRTAGGIGVTKRRTKKSSSSIKIVMGGGEGKGSRALKVQEVSVKEGGGGIEPESAVRAIKQAKAGGRMSRKRLKPAAFVSNLDGRGRMLHTKEDFVNEQLLDPSAVKKEPDVVPIPPPPPPRPSSVSSGIWRPVEIKQEPEDDEEVFGEEDAEEEKKPHLIYELTSEDGFRAVSRDPSALWRKVFEAVQEAREDLGMEPLPSNPLGDAGLQMLGLTHSALAFLLEQYPAAKEAEKYEFRHHEQSRGEEDGETTTLKENPSGCARAEPFKDRNPLDMFSWLASRHRKRPLGDVRPPSSTQQLVSLPMNVASVSTKDLEIQLSTNRRATSLDLPMAMRFRHLAKNAKEAVGVYSSAIHGRGLYCKRDIQAGEMVIEYAGEEIRAMLTDKREKHYESRGIGCYMFKIDDDTVVDATMKGNAARFINHSCDPNCYSKIVDILGKKHIIIFALRKIYPGEELTYDYKFPIEEVKLKCTCGAKRCRKYMN